MNGQFLFWVHLPDERVTSQGRKASTRRRERKKEGRRTREKAREKEQLLREREKALNSIHPETNNSVLSWINTRISFLLPFTPALDNKSKCVDTFWRKTIWSSFFCIWKATCVNTGERPYPCRILVQFFSAFTFEMTHANTFWRDTIFMWNIW